MKQIAICMAWLAMAAAAVGCQRQAAPLPRAAGQTATPVALNSPASRWNPTFVDVDGRTHRPADETDTKAIALVFILTDCPIANSYQPALNRLYDAFGSRGVALFLIHADPAVTAEQAREHARQFEIRSPVVLDPEHRWVKQAGATVTPEATVFSPTGEVLYRGRIDDQYVGVGQRRTQVTSHDLEDALTAILAGRPVPQPRTEAVGCFIPELNR